jgi:O-antigen ligase/polysaccharide polymerase Wzy-like membrane protein
VSSHRATAGTAATWIAGLTALALPVVLAFRSGGYGVPAQTVALAVVLPILAVAAVLAPWPLVPRGWPVAALAALLGLTAWAALSISWARLHGEATHDVYRLALYCAVFLLALIGMREPRLRRHAPSALLAGIVMVVGYALAARFAPSVVDAKTSGLAGDRLNQPLTYWNALGVLSAMGVVLAVAGAVDVTRSMRWRALTLAAAVPCGVAMYLTFSRAAWPALAVGLVLVLLLRPRLGTLIAAALAMGTTGMLIAVVQAFPAVLEVTRAEATRTRHGLAFGAILIAATAAMALLYPRLAQGPAAARELRLRRNAVVAIAVGSLLTVFALGAWTASRGEKVGELSKGAGRIRTLETNRGDLWRVGLEAFADHPVAGVGSASFQVEWYRERDEPSRALDAHSLYVETLAELGMVGGLLLAAFIAALATGIVRAARAGPYDPVVPAAAGAVVAFAVHAGFDWDWEMPTVALIALVLAAAALRQPEPRLSP